MKKKQIALFLSAMIICCCLTVKTQKINIVQPQESTRLPYVIVLNEVDTEDKGSRHLIILIKKESFTQDNLVKILRLVETRYPKPLAIQLDFYTDLDDIETPEERDAPHATNHNATKDKQYKGDYAVFIRIGKDKYGNCLMYFADGKFQEVKITSQQCALDRAASKHFRKCPFEETSPFFVSLTELDKSKGDRNVRQ